MSDEIIELDKNDEHWEIKRTPKKFPYLNLVLFILTFFTTTFAGSLFSGNEPKSFSDLTSGLPFSVSLLTILLFHEFGHYIMSRKYNVEATLPYFIPAPSFIGTFGAIIKMKSIVRSKKALINIGATGPLAGFLVSLPFLFYGLSRSTMTKVTKNAMILGDSVVMKCATYLVWGTLPEGQDLILHPVAFAAWIGMFVTAMNLIPVGQLDGGHIIYALFTKSFKKITFLSLTALIILGLTKWEGWLIWAFLLFFLGKNHPPVEDVYEELPLREKLIGYLSIIVFLITFIPTPFSG
ncbi:MAG: site-2 protease family protein [bacterium]